MCPSLRPAFLLLLVVACSAVSCGIVTPASGPPTYGDFRSHGGA